VKLPDIFCYFMLVVVGFPIYFLLMLYYIATNQVDFDDMPDDPY
jgi:hypothetical protein